MKSADWRARLLLQPITQLRLAASVLIVLSVIAGIAVSWSNWDAYFLATAYAEQGTVTMDQLVEADKRTEVAFWTSVVLLVLSGVAFVTWLYRARANAERLCHAEHTLGKGWVIGGWIVPVVNLWFPYQLVRDVWKASKPGNKGVRRLAGIAGSPTIALWWGLWVLAIVIDRLGFLGEPQDLDDLQTISVMLTAVAVLKAAAALVLLRVMAEISGWQEQARTAAA